MKIDFEFDTAHGIFRDALHLSDDHTFTAEEIESFKQQRLDNWIAILTAPPQEVVLPETVVQTPSDDYIEVNGIRYMKVGTNG